MAVIVTFDDGERDPVGRARALMAQAGGEPTYTYQHAIKGFAARLSAQAVENMRAMPGVKRVEPDGVARASGTMAALSWGQDRIDQRALPLDQSYTFPNSGSGVRIYILDTGILPTHQEFTGRLLAGYSAFGDNNTVDCYGHGTHVAGTAAGATVGTAPGASLVPVRVLDCTGSGSWSGIIAGIDWVTAQKTGNPSVPMVANMSLGGSVNSSVNDAVTRSIQSGVVYAVSAGNNNTDACLQSPAATPNALTVAATDASDARASFSNFGSCTDLFAPGAGIYSAYYTGSAAYTTLSGTSMASPHVAGVAALVLSQYPAYTPAQVTNSLIGGTTANLVTGAGTGSPNRLLSVMFGASTLPADTTPPTTVTPTLSVSKRSNRNSNFADLSWTGVTGSSADVWRNNVKYATVSNTGAYTDSKLPRGTYSYRVCNVGTTVCSSWVSVTF